MATAAVSHHRPINNATAFQKILDENAQLIQTISEFQRTGRITEAQHLQQLLHKNLVQLATVADNSLLADLQMNPMADIQLPSTQASSQRAGAGSIEQAPNTGTFQAPQTDSSQTAPVSTSDKENRPVLTPYTPSTDARTSQAPIVASGGVYMASNDGQSGVAQQQMAPAGHASYEPQSGQQQQQMQQPLHHMAPPHQQHQHQQPQHQQPAATMQQYQHQQQQSAILQQPVQHMPPSTMYSQQHQYYPQPHYQQQQMVAASGNTGYPMARTGPPQAVAQMQPDAGYYGGPQQRYQYPAAAPASGPNTAVYQHPVAPSGGQPYGTPYQAQPVRVPATAYGYNYQQQAGTGEAPQHQMGPPQNYPQAYHQANFAPPQVTAGQSMHYQPASSNS